MMYPGMFHEPNGIPVFSVAPNSKCDANVDVGACGVRRKVHLTCTCSSRGKHQLYLIESFAPLILYTVYIYCSCHCVFYVFFNRSE